MCAKNHVNADEEETRLLAKMPKTYGLSRSLSHDESSLGSIAFKIDISENKTRKFTRKKLVEPDGGWGWLIVFGVALSHATCQALLSIYGLLFIEKLTDLNIDTKGAAAIFSVQTTALNFSGLVTGQLMKKFQARGTALLGSTFVVGGLLLTTYVDSLFGFIFTYSLFTGFGLGFLVSSTFITIDSYFNKHKGLAVSLALTGAGVGQMLMPFLIKYLLSEFGFKSTILILAGVAAHSYIGVTLYHPVKWHMKEQKWNEDDTLLEKEKSNQQNLKNMTETETPLTDKSDSKEVRYEEINKKDAEKVDENKKERGMWSKFIHAMDWDLLKDLSFLNLLICIAAVYTSNMCLQMLYPFFLEDIGFPLSRVAICMSVLSGADIVGRLIVHVFTDTFKMKYKTVLFMGAGLSAIARSALASQRDFIVILVLAACTGICRAAIVCNLVLSISEQVEKDKLPSAVGLHMVFKGIATMSIGPLIGFIRDYTQSYSLSIHIVSVFLLALPFLTWLIERLLTKRVKR